MKKQLVTGALLCAGVLLFGGCTNSKDAAEATTEAVTDTIQVDYSAAFNTDGTLTGVDASKLVTLCKYDTISVKKADVEPEDSLVEQQITSILQSNGETEGKAENGDTVNIDYSGSIDGEKFDGGTASAQFLELGSKSFIDDFEDQIVGHEPGDTFDVNVTFPEDYQAEDLAGKDAVFEVTLNSIVPELTDAFVEKTFGESMGIKTAKALKKTIKDNLRAQNTQSYVMNYIVENSEVKEIPEDVMNVHLTIAVDEMRKQYHDYYGLTDEQILEYNQVETLDELKETMRESTEERVKNLLVVDAFCKAENITVKDGDVAHYVGEANVDSVVEMYGEAYVNAQVLSLLAIDALAENAVVK